MKRTCIAALLLLCCSLASVSARSLSQAPPTMAPYHNTAPTCTPANPTVVAGLGGFYGHGGHLSLGCASGQIVTGITLGTSATIPAVVSSIAINCTTTAFGSPNYGTAKTLTVPIANQTTNYTSLTSLDGFNGLSVWTSNTTNPGGAQNRGVGLNPILSMTFSTADGQTISAGTPGASITGDLAGQSSFDIPSNARISGFGVFYSTYINGLNLVLICPDQAPSAAPAQDASTSGAPDTSATSDSSDTTGSPGAPAATTG